MKTQKKYRKTIEKGQAIVQTVCVNIDEIRPIAHALRVMFLLAAFVFTGLKAYARPHYGPSFGYHHHHYVYYPKQNFYYDPFVGTYIVYERGVWVRQLEPPRLLTSININILPHVDIYAEGFYPQYYNHEHRETYRLIYLVAPSTTFYVFRLPQRYDFTISPYEYYRPPHRHIVYYNPNYYYHRDRYPRGHAYGHYKHGHPYYAYNSPYHYHPHHGAPKPFGKPHGPHGHNGPSFNGVGKPSKAKPAPGHHPAPFGTRPNPGKHDRPFGTMPQKSGGAAKKGNPGPQMTPQRHAGPGNGKKNMAPQQAPNNGNWQRPGGNREQNMQQQKNAPQNYPQQRNTPQQRPAPQPREQRPVQQQPQQRVRSQERNVQGAPRMAPNQRVVGAPEGGKRGR